MESSAINSSLAAGIVSILLVACAALMLASCAACTRLLRKKKNNDSSEEKDAEKAGIAMEEQDGADEKSKENGVTNVAFEPAADDAKEETATKENADTKPVEEKKEEKEAAPVESTQIVSADETEKPEAQTKQVDQLVDQLHEVDSEFVEEAAHKKVERVLSDDAFEPEGTKPSGISQQQSVVKIEHERVNHFSLHKSDVDDFSLLVTNEDAIQEEEADAQESAAPPRDGNSQEEEGGKEEGDLSRFDGIFIRGGWRRSVNLKDLVDLNLITASAADKVKDTMQELGDSENKPVDDELKPYLCGSSPVAGILISETSEKTSIYKSAKDGILRRGTAISLLEAQAATGNIIDPLTGRKMSAAEALQLGLLDKVYETVVSRAERAVTGYKSRVSEDVLSLGQAMERGLVIESHGVRLLEAQLATGGIIDHKTNVRLPLDVAVEQGLLDRRIADVVKAACSDAPMDEVPDHLKTFFDPNTEENVTYSELMRRCVVDEDTGMRLYPLEKIGRKRHSYGSHSGRSSLASSRASSKESIPAAVAASSP